MVDQSTLFEEAVSNSDVVVKNGLCNICKGSKKLCGKDRCPLMIKFYSQKVHAPKIDTKDIAGCSPPSVFVGRYGYPKVEIGPLLPTEFGDTSIMDMPERWVGRSIPEIADLRFRLVRGKYTIDAKNFQQAGRIVDEIQELSLTEKPVEVETTFEHKPTGRIVLDDEVQPFGPSGKMATFRMGTGRFEKNLEKSFYDTDLRSTDAVMMSYRNGTLISEIEKAFSVGTMGIGKNRRFVPTRWSITAVDDIIGKGIMRESKYAEPIGEYRLYQWDELDNRWSIIMIPTTWRFEMLEAWYPGSSWNPTSDRTFISHEMETFDGRSEYATTIGGAYYAARLAVSEMLERENKSAAVIVLREIHPGYVLPLGVWNIRENVRAALRQKPYTFENIESLWNQVDLTMDIKRDAWYNNSELLKDWKVQRRIEDFY